MKWYYFDGRSQVGPLDEAEVVALVEQGFINSETMVWREELEGWLPAKETELSSKITIQKPVVQMPPPMPTKGTRPLSLKPQNTVTVDTPMVIGCVLGVLLLSCYTGIFCAARNNDTKSSHYTTSERYINIPMATPHGECPNCGGTGMDRFPPDCNQCRGNGTILTPSGYATTCPRCGGTGKVSKLCSSCGGTGKY